MHISYDRKMMFVAVPKTAGTSVERALEANIPNTPEKHRNRFRRNLVLLGPAARLFGIYREIEFRAHTTARTVQICVPPEVYDSMFKFAFVRNPWDRLVSLYGFLQRRKDHRHHPVAMKMKNFEEFLVWALRRSDTYFQYPSVTGADGNLIVDYIGYYERLNEDFEEICKILQIDVRLPHLNKSEHQDYREYYTPETRKLVAHHFRRDIELFGYGFDGVERPLERKKKDSAAVRV